MDTAAAAYFDHAWDLLVVATMAGELTDVNPAWTRVLGWRREQLLGIRYLDLVHPDDLAETRTALTALRRGEVITGLANRYRAVDGRYRWLEWNVVADLDAGLARGVAREVTEQRREATLLRHVEQLSQIGSWEFELGSEEVWWSQVTHELHGTDPAQGPLTVAQAVAFYSAEVRDRIQQAFETLVATGDGYDLELPLTTADGRVIWVRTTGRARRRDEHGAVTSVYGTIADVTLERQRRRELLRFKEFVELAHDGVWELDGEGRTSYANRRMAELLARPVAELAGVVASSLVVEEDRERFVHALSAADEARAQELELRLALSDGTARWVQLALRLCAHNGDRPSTHLAVVADVSALKESEERSRRSEAQLRAFFDLAPTPILVTRWPDGELLDGNLAAAALLGCPIDELQGHQHHDLLLELNPARLGVIREQLSGTARYGPIEREIVDVDGATRQVVLEGVLVPMAVGEPAVWTVIDDVTERRRVERLKQEFVATVSHELRTPLTSITGAVDLLARAIVGEVAVEPDRAVDLVGVARRNTDRLSALVDDLLDLSRIDAEGLELDLEELDLGVVVEESIAEHATTARDRGVEVTLSTHGPTPIRGEVRRLLQVVGNLLANAISFSAPGSVVEVSVQRRGQQAELRVRDHGPGVPADFESLLFEPFTQADSSDRRARGGTGLGLSIVERVTIQHGGRAAYERPPDGGACFLVELPLAGTAP